MMQLFVHSFPTLRSSDLAGDVVICTVCWSEIHVQGLTGSRIQNCAGREHTECGIRSDTARGFQDRKSTRLNSSHKGISHSVCGLRKNKNLASILMSRSAG